MLQMNNEGRRGIMVAELEHHAGLLFRRVARLQADLEAHFRLAQQLEISMQRFSVIDAVAFADVRQRTQRLRAALADMLEHWQASAVIVEHDIMGTSPSPSQSQSPSPNKAQDEHRAQDPGGGEGTSH